MEAVAEIDGDFQSSMDFCLSELHFPFNHRFKKMAPSNVLTSIIAKFFNNGIQRPTPPLPARLSESRLRCVLSAMCFSTKAGGMARLFASLPENPVASIVVSFFYFGISRHTALFSFAVF